MSLKDIQARLPRGVTLVAVSKGQDAEKISALIAQGQRVFGENRVREAEEKWPFLRAKHPDVELHFIGHLQTNKAGDAVALFDVIDTVDSEKLARALKDEMEKRKKNLPCFIQVNTGEEPQKGGVTPQAAPALYKFCRDIGLNVRGLMCIPPEGDVPEPHFALLHKIGKELGLPHLSMGMSGDYEAALRFGATHIRLGTALFGPRQG
jgi:pyridoxal phosphate enzyme (YggS family)